jgi:intein/homing endonuclease
MPLVYGSGVHATLAAWYEGKSAGTALKAFEEVWEREVIPYQSDMTEDDPKRNPVRWAETFMLYRRMYREESFTVRNVEAPFFLPLTNRIAIAGIIDLLVKYLNSLMVIDHKGLRIDEQVMTPDGWKRNGDLTAGDFVIGSDGKPTEVQDVYDLGVKDVYRVYFSDKTFLDTTDDHVWELWEPCLNKSRIRSTASVSEELSYINRQSRFTTLPKVSPIQWPERDLKIDPYTLGVILGDGALTTGKCSISNPDTEVMDRVAATTRVVKVNQSSSSRCPMYRTPDLNNDLRVLGLLGLGSHQKFVPEEYLYSSEQQRRDLLAGLLDTDGSTSNRRIRFITTSSHLKDAVEHLVRSLGGRAESRKTDSWYSTPEGLRCYTRDSWCVNIATNRNPFYLARKAAGFVPRSINVRISAIKKIDPAPMRCIRVAAKDHLYTVKNCIVTHNTTSVTYPSYFAGFNPNHQFGMYLLGATEVLKEPVTAALINCIVTHPTEMRPEKLFIRQPTSRSLAQFELMKEEIIGWWSIVQECRRTRNWPRNDDRCQRWKGGCDYHQLCVDVQEDYRKIKPSKAVYRESVWDPIAALRQRGFEETI